MDNTRNFLEVALSTGMETRIISPDDVLRHIEPDVLASHLPDEAKTKLLSASIKAGRMDPTLVFETLSPRVFAEHMPEAMLWACISEAAERVLKDDTPSVSIAASKTPSLLGDAKAGRSRRSTQTRRSSRLGQQRHKSASKTATPDLENTDLSSIRTGRDALTDEVFGDWVEETISGGDVPRRKR